MRTTTSTIGNRLDVYGPSVCHCGNRKETVFVGRYQLSCRNHPGHPLYTERGRHVRAIDLDELARETVSV